MGSTSCKPWCGASPCCQSVPKHADEHPTLAIVRNGTPGEPETEPGPTLQSSEDLDADGYDVKDGRRPGNSDSNSAQNSRDDQQSYFTREVQELLALPKSNAKDGTRAVFTFASGSTYRGQWQGNMRHGWGKQRWTDGAQFSGSWGQNAASGFGEFRHADGSIYIGQWARNSAHGLGTLVNSEGVVTYRGEWVDDLQHGSGVENRHGGIYTGQFTWGKKQGRGQYEWPDGSSYRGDWFSNHIRGFGSYESKDGRQFNGTWEEALMHGCGRYHWPDGRIFEGRYVRDRKEGFGVYLWKDGKKFEGWWVQGVQHGNGVLYDSDGSVFRTGAWKMGKPVSAEDAMEIRPPEAVDRIRARDDGYV